LILIVRKELLRLLIQPWVMLPVWGAVFLLQTALFRSASSITFDETAYLSLSLQSVHDARLDPRFAQAGIAPLPMLLTYIPALQGRGEVRRDPWQGQLNDPDLIRGPRLWNSIAIGLPLIALVYAWIYRRHGALAAGCGAAMLSFSPAFIAHAGLATTDLCFTLFAMLALAATAWYFNRPTWLRFCMLAVAIGAATSAKYSGVFLLPMTALLFAMDVLTRQLDDRSMWRRAIRRGGSFLLLVALSSAACWMFHLFMTAGPLKAVPVHATAEYSPWLRILGRGPVADWMMTLAHERLQRPTPVEGLFFQIRHNADGHPAFLMGRVSQHGWWYYFPLVFAFKSTTAELSVAVIVLLAIGARCAHPFQSLERLDPTRRTLLVAAGVFIALLLTSHINLGQRYLLLLYPIGIVAAADVLMSFASLQPKLIAGVAGVLVFAQVVSSVTVAPHDLAYFNIFAGGPERGRTLLVDSNLDWGQDLPALAEFQQRHPGSLVLAYYGTALPKAYGVRADNIEELPEPDVSYDFVAISATHLQGHFPNGFDPFRQFRSLQPRVGLGHSLFVFDGAEPATQTAYQHALNELAAQHLRSPVRPRWHSASDGGTLRNRKDSAAASGG